MAEKPDKRNRKEAIAQWKAQQKAAARAKLPLADGQMRDLFDFLSAEFPRQGCDHSLRLTRRWLGDRGLEAGPVLAWLNENGGNCDCEALANAEEAWRSTLPDAVS